MAMPDNQMTIPMDGYLMEEILGGAADDHLLPKAEGECDGADEERLAQEVVDEGYAGTLGLAGQDGLGGGMVISQPTRGANLVAASQTAMAAAAAASMHAKALKAVKNKSAAKAWSLTAAAANAAARTARAVVVASGAKAGSQKAAKDTASAAAAATKAVKAALEAEDALKKAALEAAAAVGNKRPASSVEPPEVPKERKPRGRPRKHVLLESQMMEPRQELMDAALSHQQQMVQQISMPQDPMQQNPMQQNPMQQNSIQQTPMDVGGTACNGEGGYHAQIAESVHMQEQQVSQLALMPSEGQEVVAAPAGQREPQSQDGEDDEWMKLVMHVQSLPTNNGVPIRNGIRKAIELATKSGTVSKEVIDKLAESISQEVYKPNSAGASKRTSMHAVDLHKVQTGQIAVLPPPPQARKRKVETEDEWMRLVDGIRVLPTNNGGLIATSIYKAVQAAEGRTDVSKEVLDLLRKSIGGDVYKSNNAGPTKRMALQALDIHRFRTGRIPTMPPQPVERKRKLATGA